jgi:hypothetical protein
MFSSLSAFLLILTVCAALCLRCLFQDRISRDSLSVLALANMVLCVLCLFAWDLSLAFLLVFFLTFIVLLINLRCMLRVGSHLRHGGFSAGFVIASLLTLLPVIVCGVLLVYYRPVSIDNNGVTKQTATFTGSFRSGFFERSAFQPLNALVTSFAPNDMNERAPLVLFVSPDESSASDYEPFFLLLCKEGYEIKAAEFWTFDSRRFSAPLDSKLFRKFAARLNAVRGEWGAGDSKSREYAALIDLYGKDAAQNGRRVYLLCDYNVAAAIKAAQSFPEAFAVRAGPKAGFGCIEQTEPLLARVLGFRRDKALTLPHKALAEWQTQIQGRSY